VRSLVSPLSATLLLSNPGATPLKWELGSITLPAGEAAPRKRHDLPPREGEPAFAPLPQITHTFRADEKVIGFPKAAIGVAALILPWGVLFALVSADEDKQSIS
jgi:oligosaccharyltransferase complex subunit delta (ribophorin II)